MSAALAGVKRFHPVLALAVLLSLLLAITQVPSAAASGSPPTVSFSATPSSISTSSTVTFTPTVTGATTCDWDYGDGSTLANQSPSAAQDHAYYAAGSLTATLTCTGAGGTTASQQTIVVEPPSDMGSQVVYAYGGGAYPDTLERMSPTACSGGPCPPTTIVTLPLLDGGTVAAMLMDPAVSPDGKEIAIASNADPNSCGASGDQLCYNSSIGPSLASTGGGYRETSIFILRSPGGTWDGSDTTWTWVAGGGSSPVVYDIFPHFSPDGSKLLYQQTPQYGSYGAGSVYSIHVVNADGTGDTDVFDTPYSVYGGGGSPLVAWTPQGQIAFVYLNGQLCGPAGYQTACVFPYLINADGSNLQGPVTTACPGAGAQGLFTQTYCNYYNGIAVNPEGTKILTYDPVSGRTNSGLETINLATGAVNLIVPTDANLGQPSVGPMVYSPSGSTILFNNSSGLVTLPADGSSTTPTSLAGLSTAYLTGYTWAPSLGTSSAVPVGQLIGGGGSSTSVSAGIANNPSASKAEPVNTATGAFWTKESDMQMPGVGLSFQVERSYDSQDTVVGDFGQGWVWNYGSHLVVAPNGDVTVYAPNGQQVTFGLQGDGSYQAAGATATLTLANGVYTLTNQSAESYQFDSNGNLLSLSDRNGNTITFNRDGNGVLQTITDTAGRTIAVSHNASGYISEIALPDGRNVQYGYTNGFLTTVTDLRGKTWTYSYDSGGRLASIEDPLGHLEVQNTYDPTTGRVIQQLDALGNPTNFSWDADTQTATTVDPAGGTTTDVYSGGELISRTDPLGHKTTYAYDANFNRTSVTTPRGNVAGCGCAAQYTTTMTYDVRGNMLTKADPLGNEQIWTYDAFNDVLTYQDARHNTTSFTYDANGNLTKKTQPGNVVTLYGRDPNGTGELVSTTTPRGKVWTYGYDSQGNRVSDTDPLGHETTYGYDPTGRMTSITDPRGNVAGCGCAAEYTTVISYDNANHVLSSTDPLGSLTQYTYDADGRKQTVENAKQQTTTYGYNAASELTSITYPDQSSVSYSYDSRGNKTSYTDQLGHETTYTYDAADRKITEVSPLGNVQGGNPADYTTSYGYDADGNLISVTDPLGHETTYTYDALNRKTSMTSPRGNVAGCGCVAQYTTSYGYDPNGNLTSVTDPLGNITQYGYDALNQKTSITDGRNKTTTYGYDADGNLISVTDQDGHETTYAYDAADRKVSMVGPRGNVALCGCAAQYTTTYGYDVANELTSVTDPNGNETQYGYDAAGNKTSKIDPKQNETDYGYDALNRLTGVTAPASGTTRYRYDNVGNLITRTDANQHVTTYNFDVAHRLTSVVKPSGTWSYSYDANNELTQKVDANGNAAQDGSGTTTYSYNTDGTLASTSYSDGTPTVSYTYDPDGNVLTMSDGQASLASYTWNADDQLLTSTRGSSGFSYQYDAAGNVSQRTYPDGTVVNYAYDNEERPSSVTVGSSTTSYSYDPASELTQVTLPSSNGYAETASYDPAGQLTQVKNANGSGTLSQYDLTYDANGNPLQLTAQNNGSSWVENYTYDQANRLTGVCYQVTCQQNPTDYSLWTYDNVGNRLSETDPSNTSIAYNYNPADELTSSVKSVGGVSLYASTVEADGASPYFRFDESSGSTFSSTVGTLTGSWTGSPTLGVTGALNGDSNTAVTLDGSSQYGTVADNSSLDLANNFTIELWVKRSQSGTSQAVAGKPLTTSTTSENYAIWIDSSNKVRFEVGNGLNGKSGASASVTSSGAIDTGWHQIDATFSSGVMTLYVDGSQVGTTTASFTSAGTNTSELDIGFDPTDGHHASAYYGGTLDELSIYPTALTPTQVADHYTKATTLSTQQTTTNYSYNANGQELSAGADSFNWNVAGQITSDTVAGTSTSYTYDGSGNRVSATSGGQTTNYLWDTNGSLPQLAEQTDGSSNVLSTYVQGANGPISETTPAGSFYYLSSAGGSVADITSSTGTTEWAYQYNGFGGARTTSKVDPNAPANPLQYSSQYSDGNGLYNLRAREFDTTTGRFLSTDPLNGSITDPYLSAYVYAGDQPTLFTDPSGQSACSTFGISVVCDTAKVVWGADTGVYHLWKGLQNFVPQYPAEFNAIENGVAQQGLWGFWGHAWATVPEECGAAIQTGDFRAIGRDCAKAIAQGLPVAGGALKAGALLQDAIGAAAEDEVFPAIKAGAEGGPTAGKAFPRSVHQQALEENPSTCVFCRMETKSPQVDHAIARANGGNATLENAQTTCPFCNASKGDRPFPLNPPPGYEGPFPPPWWEDQFRP